MNIQNLTDVTIPCWIKIFHCLKFYFTIIQETIEINNIRDTLMLLAHVNVKLLTRACYFIQEKVQNHNFWFGTFGLFMIPIKWDT